MQVNGSRGSEEGNPKAEAKTGQMRCNIAVLFRACRMFWHPLLCCKLELAIFLVDCHLITYIYVEQPKQFTCCVGLKLCAKFYVSCTDMLRTFYSTTHC